MQTHVEVPPDALSPETLESLLEEFVSREGTDYGEREFSLAEKRAQLLAQLRRGEIAIVFELASESTTLVRRETLSATIGGTDPEAPEDP